MNEDIYISIMSNDFMSYFSVRDPPFFLSLFFKKPLLCYFLKQRIPGTVALSLEEMSSNFNFLAMSYWRK